MTALGLPSLIVGLIFWIAGGSWFAGATTIGVILTIASVLWLLLCTALVWVMWDDGNTRRNRRGF